MKWLLGLLCLVMLGVGMSEAGLFARRNACAQTAPAASCAGTAPAVVVPQAVPAAGCAGTQVIRERRRIFQSGCTGTIRERRVTRSGC